MLPSIQHAGIFLSGFFEYELGQVQDQKFADSFAYNSYFTNSREYFEQKYFPNWLQTLYPQGKTAMTNIGLGILESNHLLKKNISNEQLKIAIKDKIHYFRISKVDLHFFRYNLGVFIIGIQPEEEVTFETIADLVHVLRYTTDNQKYPNTNPLFIFIESMIIPYVHSNTRGWRKLNPQLKAFLNIDTKTAFESDDAWNAILTDLATANPIRTIGHRTLYDFHSSYYQQLLNNNLLNIYHNWRTMILFDTVVRISINLKQQDKNNMWDNEYITIYTFILYIQLYLFRMQKELAEVSAFSHKAAKLRDEFMRFRHDFDLSQISYKFLPNEIFKKLNQVLEISPEIDRIDEKINRIDTSIREKKENNIEILLRFIAFITCISILWDASSLILAILGVRQESELFQKMLFLVIPLLILAGIFTYRQWRKTA